MTRMKLLTTNEVAAIAKVDSRTVARWLREGRIKGVKLNGRTWRIEEQELTEFLDSQRVGV